MGTTWGPWDVETTWGQHGDHRDVETIWGQHGDNMRKMWRQHGDHRVLETTWGHGDNMVTT